MQNWNESRARSEVARLVNEYDRAKSEHRLSWRDDPLRVEENTKKDLILPLFRALDWRIEDSREVSAESAILRKRADYAFKVGGATKFCLEAKSLSVDVWDPKHLQQAIDYSHNKGSDWAVLTNFARTVVLYAQLNDPNPFNAVFLDLSAEDYLSKFEDLRLLSKPAIQAGDLDRKAETYHRKPRKQPIDKQLLSDLNEFRLGLAKDVRRLNGDLFTHADEALEETIQRILDRLIFIRVAEDRGLEDRQLALLANGPESVAVRRLRELFRRYDENFDSKLFQHHAADNVRIDGVFLQKILRRLHETRDGSTRYDFGAIDADVLGVMYEQYLGLALRQTAKRAKLTNGATNRKEQGIYYTPTWIVDYIVGFSIGEALKRRGVRPESLRLLDPACGSGTFLLRAFDHVIRARNPTGTSVQSRFDPDSAGPLLALRNSVLTENLFGVDLDARAVEIAQLNLMIRAAESRLRLPTLERNVRVGNSLIADPAVDSRAVDWANTFPSAMSEGGFDVIVTNPPYVRIQNLSSSEVDYFGSRFHVAGDFDIYTLFVQQAWNLLRDGGVAGFILPNKFLNAQYGRPLREFLAERGAILKLLDFRDYQVFEDATTYTCLLFLRKGTARDHFQFGSLNTGSDPSAIRSLTDEQFIESEVLVPKSEGKPWTLVPADKEPLFTRLDAIGSRLGDLCRNIYQGLVTGANPAYIVTIGQDRGSTVIVRNLSDGFEAEVEKALLRQLATGKEIFRWRVEWEGQFVIYPYEVTGETAHLISMTELERKFPRTAAYFKHYERDLKNRENGRFRSNKDWHQFGRFQNIGKFGRPKLIAQILARTNSFSFDPEGTWYFSGGGNSGGGYGIELASGTKEAYWYTLGVLNSRPVEFYHHLISTPFRGGFFSYGRRFLEPLPIPEGNLESRSVVARLAEELTEAHARLGNRVEGTDRYKEVLREIDELEGRLDRLTLDLFGITTKEEKLLPPLRQVST